MEKQGNVMDKIVYITVSGERGTGKTVVLEIIKAALKDSGYTLDPQRETQEGSIDIAKGKFNRVRIVEKHS